LSYSEARSPRTPRPLPLSGPGGQRSWDASRSRYGAPYARIQQLYADGHLVRDSNRRIAKRLRARALSAITSPEPARQIDVGAPARIVADMETSGLTVFADTCAE
jgi:hypothetical protein